MAKLTDNTIVTHPDTGAPQVLQKGSDLPGWAAALVGDHLLGGGGGGYADMTVDQLKDEIDRRNEGRDDDAMLSKTGNKADLAAALEADDNK